MTGKEDRTGLCTIWQCKFASPSWLRYTPVRTVKQHVSISYTSHCMLACKSVELYVSQRTVEDASMWLVLYAHNCSNNFWMELWIVKDRHVRLPLFSWFPFWGVWLSSFSLYFLWQKYRNIIFSSFFLARFSLFLFFSWIVTHPMPARIRALIWSNELKYFGH